MAAKELDEPITIESNLSKEELQGGDLEEHINIEDTDLGEEDEPKKKIPMENHKESNSKEEEREDFEPNEKSSKSV